MACLRFAKPKIRSVVSTKCLDTRGGRSAGVLPAKCHQDGSATLSSPVRNERRQDGTDSKGPTLPLPCLV